MSITIYDGLISSSADPFITGMKIREVLEPLFFEKFEEIYRELKALPEGSLYKNSKRFYFLDIPLPRYGLESDLHQRIVDLHNSPKHTFTDADIFYDVVIIPNKADGNPLVLVYGEQNRKYTEALIKAGVVREYGYWDSSDEDEDVSEEEWQERKEAWGHLIEDDVSPSEIGLELSAPSSLQTSMHLMKVRKDASS